MIRREKGLFIGLTCDTRNQQISPKFSPPEMNGGCLRGESRDDLDGLGWFGASESRAWLFRANATGPSRGWAQLMMSIFSNTKSQAHWEEEERNTERREREKKEKEDVYLYSTTGTLRYPSSDFHQPTRHPLSLLRSCRHPLSPCLSL